MEQYVWSPYGELLAKEHFGAATVQNPVGFQGLFFIRLDGLNTDPALVASSYEFDSGGTILSRTWRGWFYARNRLYEPVLGRFTSKDPHVTGLPVNDSFAFHGVPSSVSVDGFDGPMHYGDGLSLYGFVGGNPISGSDPMGLWSVTELGVSAGVQGLLGGLFSGAISSATGGRFSDGFRGGLVGGSLGGAAGYLANAAFAASASGLFAQMIAQRAVGAVDGAVSAFGQTYYSTGDLKAALTDALFFGAPLGIAVGALGDAAVRAVRYSIGITRTGALIWLGRKTKDLVKRGWTEESIREAVATGTAIRAINKATGNPATRYVHPGTGKSVVIDDVTGEVIQLGGRGFGFGPGSGDVS